MVTTAATRRVDSARFIGVTHLPRGSTPVGDRGGGVIVDNESTRLLARRELRGRTSIVFVVGRDEDGEWEEEAEEGDTW